MSENVSKLMNFSEILYFIKEGKKAARQGWNGKSMFVFYGKW